MKDVYEPEHDKTIKIELHYEKTCFFILENKAADQLHSNRTADQRLCFSYMDSTIRNFKPLAIFCGRKARGQKPRRKFLARLYKVQVELLYSLWRPRSR